MSRFPDKIIEYPYIGAAEGKRVPVKKGVKKVKLYEKMSKEDIRNLILKKQREVLGKRWI